MTGRRLRLVCPYCGSWYDPECPAAQLEEGGARPASSTRPVSQAARPSTSGTIQNYQRGRPFSIVNNSFHTVNSGNKSINKVRDWRRIWRCRYDWLDSNSSVGSLIIVPCLVFPDINDPHQSGRVSSGGDRGSLGNFMASSFGRISLGFLGIGVTEMSDYRLPPLHGTGDGNLVQVRSQSAVYTNVVGVNIYQYQDNDILKY